MSIIDDLKRLERVGSETSRATDKLRDAARSVAGKIVDSIPDDLHGGTLPRGYTITRVHSGNLRAGSSYLVDAGGEWIESTGGYLFNDFDCPLPDQPNRAAVLDFARDVAEGLIGEVADWIAERQQEGSAATDQLEQ